MKKSLAVLLISVSQVLAVGTSHWTHTSEADFKQGSSKNIVATSLGDLKLSRSIKSLMEQDPSVTSIDCLVEAKDKTIYAGTGPEGVILTVKDDKVTKLTSIEDVMKISSLLIDSKGRLLAGTTGENAQIFVIDPAGKEKPKSIFAEQGVQYVWSMLQSSDGMIYAATGPQAKIFQIDPDGKIETIFSCKDNNIISLISDGKDTLYAGTDPNGLVYRINRKTRESFVMLDAPENEITALALDAKGNLYAGTGKGSESGDGEGELEAKNEESGRMDAKESGEPIPSEPPAVPNPIPTPPEPKPLEKVDQPKTLMIGVEEAKTDAEPEEKENPHAPTTGPDAKGPKPQPQPGGPKMPTLPQSSEGNAVYRIDPDGFVTEVFRQPAPIMCLLLQDRTILVGTSGEGVIYQIDTDADETTTLAKVDSKQVMCLLPTSDGRIILGQANVGNIAAMSSGFAAEGTFTSAALDATQISRFGQIHMHGNLSKATTLSVATRSGNISEPDDATWSKWTDNIPAKEFLEIKSPAARFFQYRITMTSDGAASPVVEDIDVAYIQPNQAPVVKGIKIALSQTKQMQAMPAGGEGENAAPSIPSQRHQTISWEATDPNNDAMEYMLQFRSTPGGQWIVLKDKLKEPTYEWDTRSLADGRYEIRVIASDAKANPVGLGKTGSRISDPIIVDNTAPVIGDVVTRIDGKTATLALTTADRTSTITGVDFAVDSATDYQSAQAQDGIFDSLAEKVELKIADLTPGPHQVMIRATDARGNQAYESIKVTVEQK